METGGFKGKMKEVSKSELYAACRERLGIKKNFCFGEYGMTELSSQCYDAVLPGSSESLKFQRYFKSPPWLKTLVIDPLTEKEAKRGKIGLLRHFDLANRGSVLAVQTQDRGRLVGDGFELLGRAKKSGLRGCSLDYERLLAGNK